MESESSLPFSQELSTCPCSEPYQSSPRPQSTFRKLILVLSFHLRLELRSVLLEHQTINKSISQLIPNVRTLPITWKHADKCNLQRTNHGRINRHSYLSENILSDNRHIVFFSLRKWLYIWDFPLRNSEDAERRKASDKMTEMDRGTATPLTGHCWHMPQ
jgi:hypothetical protein